MNKLLIMNNISKYRKNRFLIISALVVCCNLLFVLNVFAINNFSEKSNLGLNTQNENIVIEMNASNGIFEANTKQLATVDSNPTKSKSKMRKELKEVKKKIKRAKRDLKKKEEQKGIVAIAIASCLLVVARLLMFINLY